MAKKKKTTEKETRAEWWAKRLNIGMEIAGRHHLSATQSPQTEAATEAVRCIDDHAGMTELVDTEGNPVEIGDCTRYLFADGSELIVADVDETDQTMILPLREAHEIWKHLPQSDAKVIVLNKAS